MSRNFGFFFYSVIAASHYTTTKHSNEAVTRTVSHALNASVTTMHHDATTMNLSTPTLPQELLEEGECVWIANTTRLDAIVTFVKKTFTESAGNV